MCFVVVGAAASASASFECVWVFGSSGRIMALSLLSPLRRGSCARLRVVASKRWLQNRQCWVRILWRGVLVEVLDRHDWVLLPGEVVQIDPEIGVLA